MPSEARTIDNRYELGSLIGGGKSGSVYEARRILDGRTVAVKLFNARVPEDSDTLKKLQWEIDLVAKIGHVNVCAFTESGIDDGAPYAAMELLKGRSLAEQLKSLKEPLPVERVFDIIHQVITALQAVHETGVVHRNLKPSNIYLVPLDEQKDVVKLLDFGTSVLLAEAGPTPAPGKDETTSEPLAPELPLYAAPEVLGDLMSADRKADLYSAGAVLYELLTGKPPYEGTDRDAVIAQIRNGPPPSPIEVNPDIPPAVEQVILKAMSSEPELRYSSARQFKHALINRARESGLKLPGHLTRVEYTGGVPVLDPTELDAPDLDLDHVPEPAAPEHAATESGTASDTAKETPSETAKETPWLSIVAGLAAVVVFLGVLVLLKYC